MSWFFKNKKEDYERIYDNNMDYEEVDENDSPEEAIERLRGTIGRGSCLHCNGTMVYDGCCCFICLECGRSVDEDTYLRWAAGYPVEFDD